MFYVLSLSHAHIPSQQTKSEHIKIANNWISNLKK